jgi:tetratricopeptide (TPR) repeat protein
MKTLLVAFSLFCFTSAYACLNGDSRELAEGTFLYEDFEGHLIPQGHNFELQDADYSLHNLDSLWRNTHDPIYRSDYALLLILLKRYDEAEKIYLEIENEFPRRYSTASNLGTLYELMGQNENALKWISRAVEIDPESHKNSEWLHVNILKAKIQGEEAYTTEFLLDRTFGETVIPSTDLAENDLLSLREELYYQLNERMSFIKPRDKIVSILLTALGDVCWLTGSQVPAAKNYEMAKAYDNTNELANAKLKRSQEKQIVIPIGGVADSRDFSALYVVIALCTIAATINVVSTLRNS